MLDSDDDYLKKEDGVKNQIKNRLTTSLQELVKYQIGESIMQKLFTATLNEVVELREEAELNDFIILLSRLRFALLDGNFEEIVSNNKDSLEAFEKTEYYMQYINPENKKTSYAELYTIDKLKTAYEKLNEKKNRKRDDNDNDPVEDQPSNKYHRSQ